MEFAEVHQAAVKWLAERYRDGDSAFDFRKLHTALSREFGELVIDDDGHEHRPYHKTQADADNASRFYRHIAKLPTRLVEENLIRLDEETKGDRQTVSKYSCFDRYFIHAEVLKVAPKEDSGKPIEVTSAQIAKTLRCDPSTVNGWARRHKWPKLRKSAGRAPAVYDWRAVRPKLLEIDGLKVPDRPSL